MELTKEKSEEQALIIKDLQESVLLLDVEYLTECLKQMKNSLSMKQSASILDPRPFTVHQRHDLESKKLAQLELYLEIAKNSKDIMIAELNWNKARVNEKNMANLFG